MLPKAFRQEITLVSENSPAIYQRQILRRVGYERHGNKLHAALMGKPIALEVVASFAGSHYVLPSICTPSGYRRDMVSCETRIRVFSAAIHASMTVPSKQSDIGNQWCASGLLNDFSLTGDNGVDIQVRSCSRSLRDSSSETQDRVANGPAHQFAGVEACCLSPVDPAHGLT